MKWIFIFLVLRSAETQSQNEIYRDWYNIGTERLVHMRVEKNTLSWDEKTFLFQYREGKKRSADIITIVRKNDLTGLVHKDKDTPESLHFGLTVLRYNKGSGFLDLIMDCSNGSYQDTLGMSRHINDCDTSTKMIMRFYSKDTMDHFGTLKPVTGMTKKNLKKINSLFKKQRVLLIKEFGEDKLLWIAPVIFQKILTDLLLENGYNPMLTENQAEDMFSFNYY